LDFEEIKKDIVDYEGIIGKVEISLIELKQKDKTK